MAYACASGLLPSFPPRSFFCQRYSAPQSPINVIIFRPFDRSRTASISARSESERRNRNTFRLSSGCSETPRRVPFVGGGGGWSKVRREERTTRNVIAIWVVCYSKRGKKQNVEVHVRPIEKGEKTETKRKCDLPTRTAPTNGWSRTHRTAMLAMLAPPWRSPTLRNTVRSRWKRAQSPHTLVIASRY